MVQPRRPNPPALVLAINTIHRTEGVCTNEYSLVAHVSLSHDWLPVAARPVLLVGSATRAEFGRDLRQRTTSDCGENLNERLLVELTYIVVTNVVLSS